MKQIHWERWSRFYLPRGHPYLWSRARRVTQPQPRVYNMIREELALVKQNGAWKPRRKIGWSGLFYPPNGLNFQFCWFYLIFLIAPSWSESNFIFFFFFYSIRVGPSWSNPDSRSELIRSDFCTCLFDTWGILSTPANDVHERLKTNGKAMKIALLKPLTINKEI